MLSPQGLDWISALRSPQIAQLAQEHGPFQPGLFDDEYLEQASASRASPVLKAVGSAHAKAKDMTKTAADGTPLQSFRTLLADLGTLAYNITHTALNPAAKIVSRRGPRRCSKRPSRCSD